MPRPKRIEAKPIEGAPIYPPIMQVWLMQDAPPKYMRAGFKYVAHVPNPGRWSYEPWFGAFSVAEQHGELFYFG
jgi:hypothetical protein